MRSTSTTIIPRDLTWAQRQAAIGFNALLRDAMRDPHAPATLRSSLGTLAGSGNYNAAADFGSSQPPVATAQAIANEASRDDLRLFRSTEEGESDLHKCVADAREAIESAGEAAPAVLRHYLLYGTVRADRLDVLRDTLNALAALFRHGAEYEADRAVADAWREEVHHLDAELDARHRRLADELAECRRLEREREEAEAIAASAEREAEDRRADGLDRIMGKAGTARRRPVRGSRRGFGTTGSRVRVERPAAA